VVFLPSLAAPLTPLASPYLGFKKTPSYSFPTTNFVTIDSISSKKSISLDTPPPKIKASGSNILITLDKDIAKFNLNLSIKFSASKSCFLKSSKISFVFKFFFFIKLNSFDSANPDM